MWAVSDAVWAVAAYMLDVTGAVWAIPCGLSHTILLATVGAVWTVASTMFVVQALFGLLNLLCGL